MFAQEKHISLPATLVLLSICFRRIMCFWTPLLCHTSVLWLGTLLPPPPSSCYPAPSSVSLSMRTLQFCILFPLPLSPMTLEFPLYRGRAYLLVRLFLAFCALPWQIHKRSMILFPTYFTFHYPLSPFVYCSSSVVATPLLFLLPFRFRFCHCLLALQYATC